MWYDAIYISKFPTAQSTDPKLITSLRIKELAQNESYTAEFELKIPINFRSGKYFIIFQTDSLKVLEDSFRDNNQNYIALTIAERPPIDLSLHNLSFTSLNNENLLFNWALKSNSEVNNGLRCDNYYLSTDSRLDYDDYEISTGNCNSFSIKELRPSVYSEIEVSKTNKIPLIVDGEYYGIVKSISSIPETNYANNVESTNRTITIEIPELQFEKELKLKLMPDMDYLFKFNVDKSINSFRVNLMTNSKLAFHDLFANNDKQPQTNIYKAKSFLQQSFNQTLMLRNANLAVYYILLKTIAASLITEYYDAALVVTELKKIQIDSIYPLNVNLIGSNTLRIGGNFELEQLQVYTVKNFFHKIDT